MCVRFPRLRPGGTTVHSVLPPLFRFSFRVHLVSIVRFQAFAAHSCYGTISFRISVYFPFGWSSRPVGGRGEGFRDSIRLFLRVGLCMSVMQNTTWTLVGRVRANLSPTITFSDDTVGKHSRAFTTPRVVPFLFLSLYFIFYYPLNVQPRFQTILQTPLHLAFSWLGLWSTVERAERFRLVLVHFYHPPLVC